MGLSKKKNFFWKKKSKMADFQNVRFSKSPILKIFLWKFHGLVLGLVGLTDAKGIDVAQPIWSWGCLTEGQKQPKNAKKAILALFWAYVRQPDDHISWATSMPFASFHRMNLRPNPWKKIFKKNENWQNWKMSFFLGGHFEFFFPKKFFFLVFSNEKNHEFSYKV